MALTGQGIANFVEVLGGLMMLALVGYLIYWISRFPRSGMAAGLSGSSLGRSATEETERLVREGRGVEAAEIREERSIDKILKDLENRFGRLIEGKNTSEQLELIKTDLNRLTIEMQNLGKLEGVELKITIAELRKGIGVKGKLREHLERENNLLKAFKRLVTAAVDSFRTDPIQAKNYLKQARMAIRALIKVNRRQI